MPALRLFILVVASLAAMQADRPRVLLDEAHHNVHTLGGTYQNFAKLLTESGFQVRANTHTLTAAVLKDCDVLIISNARGAGTSVPLAERAAPAFSVAEIEAIVSWVRGGGALLLVTDHWPIGPANQALGERLGVTMSGGWTEDPAHTAAGPGHLVFSLENGLLADHPVTRGRRDTEQVRTVTSRLGQSLVGPPGSVSLLRLSPTAIDRLPPDRRTASAAGKSQGLAFELGSGRVVVLGEAGMLRLTPGDAGQPKHDNRQFALNVLGWLSRGITGQAVRESELQVTGKAAGMLGGGRVSPDGRSISFADQLTARAGGTGNLAIWDTQTGETRIVTTASNTTPWADGFAEDSAWSADGKTIAYAWTVEAPGRPRELRLVDVVSGQHRILFKPPPEVGRILPFAFSPDGRFVLVAFGSAAGEGTVAAAEIALVDTSAGTSRTLKTFNGSLPAGGVFSRDGKWIAFDYQSSGSASRDIAIMAVAPGGPEHTIGSVASHDVVLGWLPDGRLLFTSFSEGRTDALTVQVTDGRPAPASTVVKRDAGELSPQGVTRDGRVFLHRADNTREVFVADVDPITGKARGDAYPLPGTTPGMYRSEPAWSPDGSTIAYVESAPGLPQGVIIHNVKSGVMRRYEVGVRGIDWPRWQPDARAFIFNGTGGDNVQRSHRLWLDSGKVEPLVAGLIFGVSPDSRFFYYGGPGLDLTRRAFADGATTTIAARAELGTVQGTTLSPDGRWFAFLTGAGRQRGIAIRAVEGGTTKILVKEAAGYPRIAWTPDSRYVVFLRNPDGLHRISIDGGDPEPLNVVVRGVIGEKSVSPDGKRIAFGVSRNSSHLVVWENLVPPAAGRPR